MMLLCWAKAEQYLYYDPWVRVSQCTALSSMTWRQKSELSPLIAIWQRLSFSTLQWKHWIWKASSWKLKRIAVTEAASNATETNTLITLIIPTIMPSRPTHLNPSNLGLPPRIGSLQIPSIDWDDFKGQIPQDSPYMAHIYWTINYHYPPPLAPPLQQTVSTSVKIQSKSWVRNKDRPTLLQHEYGHLLIGCLCALQFERRVNWQLKRDPSLNMGSWCRIILTECLKEYCALERRYDDQTCHNLNKEKQREWEEWMKSEMERHLRDFQQKNKAKQSKGSKGNKSKRRVVSMNSAKSCPKPSLPRLNHQRKPFHKIV